MKGGKGGKFFKGVRFGVIFVIGVETELKSESLDFETTPHLYELRSLQTFDRVIPLFCSKCRYLHIPRLSNSEVNKHKLGSWSCCSSCWIQSETGIGSRVTKFLKGSTSKTPLVVLG